MEIRLWRCQACYRPVMADTLCAHCGGEPELVGTATVDDPAPPFAVGATLHFTGVRIPKEE